MEADPAIGIETIGAMSYLAVTNRAPHRLEGTPHIGNTHIMQPNQRPEDQRGVAIIVIGRGIARPAAPDPGTAQTIPDTFVIRRGEDHRVIAGGGGGER